MTTSARRPFPRRPRNCIWEITGACNLRCIHCANHSGERHPRELTTDEGRALLADLARLGCRTVDITGGEPLLRPDWADLCRAARALDLQVALVTNGLLLDDATLTRAIGAGVGHVAISLDGPRDVHDAIRLRPGPGGSPFEAAVAALRRSAARVPTTAITQVNLRNLPHLAEMRRLLARIGVPRWQLQLAIPTGRVRELPEPFLIRPDDLEELTAFIAAAVEDGGAPAVMTSDTIGYGTERERSLRKRPAGQGVWIGCLAGLRSVAVTYDGRVRGCSMLPSDFDAGDLHEEPFERIWPDASRFAYSTRFDATKLTGGCARCRHGPVCRAGCTTMAWWVTGTIHDNPYCLRRVREAVE